jgi:anti-anti-sigma factor
MSAGEFHATPVHADGSVVLALIGELDLAALPEFDAAVASYADTTSRLVLDLAGVTFMDSTGLTALIGLQRRLGSDGALVLRNVAAQPRRILELAGVTDHFAIE